MCTYRRIQYFPPHPKMFKGYVRHQDENAFGRRPRVRSMRHVAWARPCSNFSSLSRFIRAFERRLTRLDYGTNSSGKASIPFTDTTSRVDVSRLPRSGRSTFVRRPAMNLAPEHWNGSTMLRRDIFQSKTGVIRRRAQKSIK